MVGTICERGKLVGWFAKVKLCQLHSLFRMFPKEDSSSFTLATEALRKRFRLVDIEELRGLEFH